MVTFRRLAQRSCALVGILVSALFFGLEAHAQSDASKGGDGGISAFQLQGNVYMLAGRGGNVAVQVGEDGVLVVDTMVAEASDDLLAAIREISDGAIRYILNTHYHPDHAGGNAAIAKAGETLNNQGPDRGGSDMGPRKRIEQACIAGACPTCGGVSHLDLFHRKPGLLFQR